MQKELEEARRREEEKKEQERLEAERKEKERRAGVLIESVSSLEEERIRKKQAEERAKLRQEKKTLFEKWSKQIDPVRLIAFLHSRRFLQVC